MTQELPSGKMHQKLSINATRVIPRNIEELEKRRDDLIRNQLNMSQKKDDSIVRCECDHGLEEGDMVGPDVIDHSSWTDGEMSSFYVVAVVNGSIATATASPRSSRKIIISVTNVFLAILTDSV